jgi:hypothetical protein
MIFVLTPGAAVLAQEPMSKAKQTKMGQLALSDAVTAALENNPAIKTARAKWESARQRIPQAAAWESNIIERPRHKLCEVGLLSVVRSVDRFSSACEGAQEVHVSQQSCDVSSIVIVQRTLVVGYAIEGPVVSLPPGRETVM